MRIRFSVIICVLFAQQVLAQDWAPLRKGWVYNYTIGNDKSNVYCLWIDSSRIIDGNTVSYLNRVYDREHPTYTSPNSGEPQMAFLGKLPQFLGLELRQKNGQLYIIQPGNRQQLILPAAKLSETWLFDAGKNITATVSSIKQEAIYGIYDSIKTIVLSSGDTIRLSRNIGLLQFPLFDHARHYYLKGIEGPDVGLQVPNFKSIYDFQIGDKFEYLHKQPLYDSMGKMYVSNIIEQYSITSKTESGNGFSYEVKGYLKDEKGIKRLNTTKRFERYSGMEQDIHPNQFNKGFNPNIRTEYSNTYKTYIKHSFDGDYNRSLVPIRPGSDTLILYPGIYCYDNEAIYVPGLGQTYYLLIGITYSEFRLVAAKTTRYNFGEFTPMESAPAVQVPNRFEFYATQGVGTNTVHIGYSIPEPTRVTLTLYDMNGKKHSVLMNETKGAGLYENTFSLSNLKPAMYFLLLNTGKEGKTQKVVILK